MSQENLEIKIIKEIRNGNSNKALSSLYKSNRRLIINWIKTNKGSKEEAEDIFQDAIIAFYKYVVENPDTEIKNINGLIFSIARNNWVNRSKIISRSDSKFNVELVADKLNFDEKEKTSVVEFILSKMGDTCKQLLTYSIFYKISMEDIALRMGFNNENTAKTKNYKCKQRLVNLIKENPQYKELLKS